MKGKLTKLNDQWYVKCIEEGDWETYYQVNPYDIEKIDQYYKRAGDNLFDVEFDFKIEQFWETGIETPIKVATLIKWMVESPTVSDDFQIGPRGAYEHDDSSLDVYYYHEILDRLTVVGDIVERHLLEHPVTERHLAVKSEIESALDHLAEAYVKMTAILPDKIGN